MRLAVGLLLGLLLGPPGLVGSSRACALGGGGVRVPSVCSGLLGLLVESVESVGCGPSLGRPLRRRCGLRFPNRRSRPGEPAASRRRSAKHAKTNYQGRYQQWQRQPQARRPCRTRQVLGASTASMVLQAALALRLWHSPNGNQRRRGPHRSLSRRTLPGLRRIAWRQRPAANLLPVRRLLLAMRLRQPRSAGCWVQILSRARLWPPRQLAC